MATTKLYVGNLPEMAKEKDLRDLFQSFGEVSEVAVLRGYGFVHFHKTEDASVALDALDGSDFMEARLLVQFSRTKGHGYGRGSGPPRPRGPPRGDYRDSYRRSDSGSYRDGGSYRDRDSYHSRDRDGYRGSGWRDRDGYRGGSYSKDSRDRRYDSGSRDDRSRDYDRPRDYDRYGGSRNGYDSYYDDVGRSKYSDSRGRSRSPVKDYYRSYDRDRDSYRDSYTRDSSYRDSYRDDSYHRDGKRL